MKLINCFKVIFKKNYLLYPIKILKTCNFKPHSSYKPIYNGKREYNEIDHLFYKNNNWIELTLNQNNNHSKKKLFICGKHCCA